VTYLVGWIERSETHHRRGATKRWVSQELNPSYELIVRSLDAANDASVMTKTQAQIIELFKTLDPMEQREIAEQLYETTVVGSFYDRMTPEQSAELDEGIAQAERGQVIRADEVFDRLEKRLGFTLP
jgi:hypothetical protein